MMVSTARAVLCVSLWLCVCHVRGSHIPGKMNRTIQNLLLHYEIPRLERFNGKPVFSKEPLVGTTEAKRVFMGGVLKAYEGLIGQMLKQLPTSAPPTAGSKVNGAAAAEAGGDIRTDLNFILKKVRDLRHEHYQEQSKLLQGLQNLQLIQRDNFVVQSKALGELPWFYEEASLLSNEVRMQRKQRRRRQTQKVKSRPRA